VVEYAKCDTNSNKIHVISDEVKMKDKGRKEER
jgi:hypothetical protein